MSQKQTQLQRRSAEPPYRKTKRALEFSKRLTIADIIIYVVTVLACIIAVILRPELAHFGINIIGAASATYVPLRLGYTTKAGIENYKKIDENYKAIMDHEEPNDGEG